MYEIVKQYSGALLVGMASLMLVALLFVFWPVKETDGSVRTGSVMEDIGSVMDESLSKRVVDWESHKDVQTFDVRAERDRPSARTKRHAVEKQAITVTDLFLLRDGEGREWKSTERKWVLGTDEKPGVVDILSVVDSSGHDIRSAVYNQALQVFTFPEPDTVMVTIRVMDYDNVEATYTIPVAVDMEYP